MAVPPKFQGHALRFPSASSPGSSSSTSPSQASHTLEIYLDYVCPYSAKLFNTLYNTILPSLQPGSDNSLSLSAPLTIILRQQVQPWHPSSTLTHETALAVLRLLSTSTTLKTPEEISQKFYQFSASLFSQQKSFFDVNVVNESRNETYRRLAKIASESTLQEIGITEKDVYSLLEIPDHPAADGSLNVGNAVTNDLKLLVKMARLVGVHVSPTVVFDGVVAGEVSSSWTGEEWRGWLGRNVV